MSDSKGRKPPAAVKPELLPPAPVSKVEGSQQPTSILGLLRRLFISPTQEARETAKWTQAVRAHVELKTALKDLGHAQGALDELPTILETDSDERAKNRLVAARELEEEGARGRVQGIKGQTVEQEALAELAEARRRRERSERPPRSEPESSAAVRELRARRKNREELLAERDRLIAKVRSRAGADGLSKADELDIKNIEDDTQHYLDRLE